MPRRLYFRAFFLLLLGINASALGQINLKLSNLPENDLEPGSTRTVVLNVENTSSDTLQLQLKNNIPSPLRALLFTTKIKMMPKTTKNVLVPISIPRKTESAKYNISFSLLIAGTEVASTSAELSISKITDIKVDLINRPAYARSTDTIYARFIITNHGNAREELNLRSVSGKIAGSKSLSIPPDSTAFVDLSIVNDPHTMEVEDQLIDLFCRISGIEQTIGDQELIKVYPIKTAKVDPFFRFPVNANFSYFSQNTNGENTNSLFQFQIAGRGALDRNKKHRIDFSYRGPGAVRITRIGNFSQKYVQYTGPSFNFFVGEKTFSLSELTENFRFGTGIEVSTKLNEAIKVGGYYNRPIFQPEIREQIAGYASYSFKKKYEFRINSLNNFLRSGQTVNLSSIRTDFSNGDNWHFTTEASRSFSRGSDGSAFAYNTNILSGKFRVASNGLYADKNFKGYYNNSLFLGLNTGYNLKRIGFQINGNYNNSNPNLDTVYSIAPISFFTSAGFIGKPTKALNIQLHALYREKTDRLAGKNFDYSEERLRLTMNLKRGYFSSRLLTEAGNTFSRLSGTRQKAFGYDAQLQLNFQTKKNFGISTFTQYLSNTRFTNEASQYLLYGIDAYMQYRKKLDFSLEFQNNYLIEDLYNDRNLINFKMGYQITRGQSINLRANYGILHQNPIRRDWFLTANYMVRLGVPMIRITELGSLTGQLVNGGVTSVDNVVLMFDGQLATTDEEGFFNFNNVRPGKHELFIDKATIGVRDLPDVKLPIRVEILPEKTSNVSITMTTSAKVTGKISLDKSTRVIQSSKQEVKFPSIIVEASNGEESLLTRADGDGNFVFGSLRPGKWHFRMIPTYWKEDFLVKIPYVDLELKSGEEENIELAIKPKVRQIKFLNQKTIKVGGK